MSDSEPKNASSSLSGEIPRIVEECILTGGETLVGLIFFGSQLLQSSPDAHSAVDLFMVVTDYGAFYNRLQQQKRMKRSVNLVTLLNRILPPNVLSILSTRDAPGAKGFILSEKDFFHSVGATADDHFCRGRLSQQVRIVYARDAPTRQRLEEGIHTARRHSLRWVPAYIDSPFNVQSYCLRMLEVSFANEFRPESNDRIWELFRKQEDFFQQTYEAILEDAVSAGELQRQQGLYRPAAPTSMLRCLQWRAYFWRSRFRATLRWAKYVFTFEDWLDYIVHKIERRTGMHVTISDAERRFPFLLLWPKALRVLLALRSMRRKKQPEHEMFPNGKA